MKLCLGPLGGDVVAELPFILMHPKPDDAKISEVFSNSNDHGKQQNNDTNNVQSLIQLEYVDFIQFSFLINQITFLFSDDNDDIIFEDFARLRLKGDT